MKDEEAFTAYVRKRGDALLRTARLLVCDRQEAEDALQTALLRLSRHWPVEQPDAYVRRTLVNLANDGWRRRHLVAMPAEPVGDHWFGIVSDPAEAITDAAAAQQLLEALLSALPPKQRAAVVLRVVEQLPEAEAAAALRCSTGTVKSNLSRGLDKLRELVPARGATPEVTS